MKKLDQDSALARIVVAKQAALAAQKRRKPYSKLEAEVQGVTPSGGQGFYETLKAPGPRPKLIAEVKKASPSRGLIREDFSLAAINEAYQAAENVVAISVLTEQDHFKGEDAILSFFAEHNTHQKPLLRKDFIFDPYQVLESKLLGAQAFLLIVALLEPDELHQLIDLGQRIGIEPLVEVHDAAELAVATHTKARVIGVNSRDLKTFKVDPAAHDLLKGLDDNYARVAESGIENPAELRRVSAFCDAALVGTHFMAQPDITAAIKELVG